MRPEEDPRRVAMCDTDNGLRVVLFPVVYHLIQCTIEPELSQKLVPTQFVAIGQRFQYGRSVYGIEIHACNCRRVVTSSSFLEAPHSVSLISRPLLSKQFQEILCQPLPQQHREVGHSEASPTRRDPIHPARPIIVNNLIDRTQVRSASLRRRDPLQQTCVRGSRQVNISTPTPPAA